MKRVFSKSIMVMILVIMMVISAIPVFAAMNPDLDTSKKVSFTVTCDKPGYTFDVYKIGSLDRVEASPYETKYTSLVTAVSDAEITKYIHDGDSAGLLDRLYNAYHYETNPTGAVKVGTFGETSATVKTKTFGNLAQGIYFVKAVNYPAGVQKVQNSVFALPYFDDGVESGKNDGWVYTLGDKDPIELATKVVDKDIETRKAITNSTREGVETNSSENVIPFPQKNTEFTDVNLGDTVDFEIKSTVTGSTEWYLNTYYVTDEMSKGLTLDKNSFKVKLLREDGSVITELTRTANATDKKDYRVDFSAGHDGTDATKSTMFTVALEQNYLHNVDTTNPKCFYGSEVYYTSITYSAVLNDNAVIGKMGNPNTEGKISYSNRNNVVKEHDGNTVYVYTYAVTSDKTDPNGRPLQGATFELYRTADNATKHENAIATGVSDASGKVKYYNSKNEEISLESGTYYAFETKAPNGYNLYGKVIQIDVNATYNTTFANGTWVNTCPNNGIATFKVVDHKLITPKTGGYGNVVPYAIGGVSFVLAGVMIVLVLKKKRTGSSESK